MTTLPGTTSGLEWKEGTEGLQFGELFLGGIASTYLGRGRSPGYGLHFTDQRIICVRMRLLAQALLAPYLIVISSLSLMVLFELGSREILSIFLPLVIILANQVLRVLSRRFSERVISRKSLDVPWLIKRRKEDFELSKKEIEELLMKSPLRGLNLEGSRGYLRITPKDHQVQPIEIKVHGWNQHLILRDLVINFAGREPRVRAVEYPYGR
ncbi:hypothetical protein E6H17_03130 [Candidatus Bathyarchaeota archaeon]|nr:MAG: hypothetical protein E6H17_03130 [Candidatus Bathyarchaeota archaeon]TMI70360.1 MAG: hypothetical protein E6H11_05210 [Candidatus Bathyarchaeota archaeon]